MTSITVDRAWVYDAREIQRFVGGQESADSIGRAIRRCDRLYCLARAPLGGVLGVAWVELDWDVGSARLAGCLARDRQARETLREALRREVTQRTPCSLAEALVG